MSTQTLEPDEIARVCRRSTAHNYGQAVFEVERRDDGSVRVGLSSWPRVQEALKALRSLGYEAVEDCLPMDDGLIVTGLVTR